MKTNENKPAFACASDARYQSGLTKREYFAAFAMQGILSSQTGLRSIGAYNDEPSAKFIALESVVIADTLIEALNKEDE